MRTKQTTEISVFHTPDKGSKPDLKHQSHLRTTVPSVYEVSPQQQRTSQFGTHSSKMRNYDSFGVPGEPQTQKRASKNQWELRQKVDEYQTQIGLLRQYLQSSQCRCVEKGSISRIFGFPEDKDILSRQQQRVIKQLGNKVKGLVRENASLKSQNAHYSQLNVQQIISQNEKLQNLLQQYKKNDSGQGQNISNNRLAQQNELLKDEMYRLKLQYEERMKELQREYESKIKQMRNRQLQLVNKVRQLEVVVMGGQQQRVLNNNINNNTNNTNSKSNNNINSNNSQQASSTTLQRLQQSQSLYTKQLLQQQQFYKQQLQQQQQYYQKQKSLLQNDLLMIEDRLKQQLGNQQQLQSQLIKEKERNKIEIQRLRQFYSDEIKNIERKYNQRLNQFDKLLNMLEERLVHTDKSIEHLKFERNNRIQSTIKKSHNVAYSSIKPKGETHQDQPNIQQQLQQQQPHINTKPLTYTLNPQQSRLSSHQIDILKEKIKYLQRQLQEMKIKLTLNEKMNMEKTQKIIKLENQIKNLNDINSSLNYNLTQVKNQPIIKEIVKQVPITVTTIPKQYSQQVKNIKQTIISCNLSNFDTFQNQFHQIIEQRNQLNEKMLALKRQAKQSSKVLILQKHLKVQRERNKHLQQSLKKYEKQIEDLKIQVIELKSEIQNMHQTTLAHNIEGKQLLSNEGQQSQIMRKVGFQHLPDGKAGLEWQRIVKHCLMKSIDRLQNLQNRMRQDIGGQKSQ